MVLEKNDSLVVLTKLKMIKDMAPKVFQN